MLFKNLLFLFFVFWVSLCANALSEEFVPEDLTPWKQWVLYAHKDLECPLAPISSRHKRVCLWPSHLTINVSGKEAFFTYKVFVFKDSFVELPGSQEVWPVELSANGKKEAAINKKGKPYLFLKRGSFEIKGKLVLGDTKAFYVPQGTALLKLFLNGKSIDEPKLDTENWLLFLTEKSQSKIYTRPKKKIKLEVFRLLKDGVPFEIESVVRMFVSGEPRELVFKNMIPDGFVPVKASFPFKWAFDKSGNLYLQVRPGTWNFKYVMVNPSHVRKISYWNKDRRLLMPEIWVFKEDPSVRRVELKGGTPVDPTQTDIPEHWKNFPAFYVKKGSSLVFDELTRGSEKRPPNELSLKRTMWLGFNGNVYYVKDEISGKINSKWRLNAIPPLRLGRVVIDGRPRLITKDNNGKAGVEIRNRSIYLEAEGEMEGSIDELKGLGWEEEFSSAKIELFLPPGWSVLAAIGADITDGTLIDKWSLLDIFLLLLLSWASFKCFGILGAIFMFLFLFLGIQDKGAPVWIWLHPIIAQALLMMVKKESTVRLVKTYKFISLIGILFLVLPFSAKSIKCAIYPQVCRAISHEELTRDMPSIIPSVQKKLKGTRLNKSALKGKMYYQENQTQFGVKLDFEPEARIQTGPGLPSWQGNKVRLRWSGPVSYNQKISIRFVPPLLNLIFGITKAVAPILLLIVMSGVSIGLMPKSRNLNFILFFLVVFITSFSPSVVQCAFPSRDLLKELENRLTSPPKCYPYCTAIKSTVIKVCDNRLEFRFMIKSLADSVMRLPISLKNWQPEEVFIQKKDGSFKEIPLKRDEDGYLILAVYKGRLNVVVYGKLREDITLPVPFTLHNVTVVADKKKWKVSGIDRHLNVKSQIRIAKVKKDKINNNEDSFHKVQDDGIPPFLKISREFDLSLKWKVFTTIKRISSYNGPIQFMYKLLPGEKILTPGIKVKNGNAKIVLVENQREFYFESILNKTASIFLIASNDPLFVETWKIRFSSVWHIDFSGIPEVVNSSKRYEPLWKPWPGEKLAISISKPIPVEGPIKTVKSCTFVQKPGLRLTDSSLELDILSSIGTTQKISLLPHSKLKNVLIDGKAIPFDPESQEVNIPLHPGVTNVLLKWIEKRGIATFFQTTSFDLGLPLTNIKIELIYSQNRWPLFVKGPLMGPAVLFWGAVVLVILLGLILGKIKHIPISSLQWILLGIGLLPVDPLIIILVFGAILLLHFRGYYWERLDRLGALKFNFMQAVLVFVCVVAFFALVFALQNGLLGLPNMQIMGNGSYPGHLFWYQDKAQTLPKCLFFSTNIWIYRSVMLLWALWLVRSIINWAPWLWHNFNKGKGWKKVKFNFRLRQKQNKD